MNRDLNKKYSSTPLSGKRHSSSFIVRGDYLNNSKVTQSSRPKTEQITKNNKSEKSATIVRKNNQLRAINYSDFPMPSKRRLKFSKPKLHVTYSRIMIVLGAVLLLTIAGNGILFYNFQKNHPTTAKIVLNDDSGKGIQIDDFDSYDKTPITNDIIANYKTENNNPKYLQIQKINLNARIKIVSSDSKGSIKVPKNIHDVGWYEGSARPGGRGTVFLDGTTVFDDAQGVFANINRLVESDEFSIIMGDGLEYKYKVLKTKIVEKDDFNILTAIDPPELKGQGLSITVNYGPEQNRYKQRLIILATKIQ